ncbi:hypothetical protein PVL29_011029 [Vitis rotundifolia]|uniref:Uncharacterized protein n=1 Tax=Vitis rotundifolia TaxID=103349 RepID=A0AA39DUA7_VITRO|nr:hypothetical protein PVL29_011029 [Vitis rotundifolia]
MILGFLLYAGIFLQENCFLIIIVISMGNRYDCLLVSPRLTVRISSFLSYIFFHPQYELFFFNQNWPLPSLFFFCFFLLC